MSRTSAHKYYASWIRSILAKPIFVAGVGAALVAFWSCYFSSIVDDDAFIPIRYALNWVRGFGPVMNPFERVEGCTSPLHLAFDSFAGLVFNAEGIIVANKVAGFCLALITLYLTAKIAQKLLPGNPIAWRLAVLLLASWPLFAVAMGNAMETPFAVTLLAGAVLSCLGEEKGPGAVSGVLFGLAALARPELIAVLPILMLLSPSGYRPSLSFWLSFVIPVGLVTGIRYMYYGDVLPNTFYAKHIPFPRGVIDGLKYLNLYFSPYGVLGLCFLAALPRRVFFKYRVIPSVLIALFCFLIWSSGTWMRDGRLIAPAWPLVAALIGGSVVHLEKRLIEHRNSWALLVYATWGLISVVIMCAWFARQRRVEPDLWTRGDGRYLSFWKVGKPDGRRQIAEKCLALTKPGDTVAVTEMGIATILAMHRNFLDLRGLTDKAIAKCTDMPHGDDGIPGNDWALSPQIMKYVLHTRPNVIIAGGDGPPKSNLQFYSDYKAIGTFKMSMDNWYVVTRVWRSQPRAKNALVSRAPITTTIRGVR
jgi:hypothetical protein